MTVRKTPQADEAKATVYGTNRVGSLRVWSRKKAKVIERKGTLTKMKKDFSCS